MFRNRSRLNVETTKRVNLFQVERCNVPGELLMVMEKEEEKNRKAARNLSYVFRLRFAEKS